MASQITVIHLEVQCLIFLVVGKSHTFYIAAAMRAISATRFPLMISFRTCRAGSDRFRAKTNGRFGCVVAASSRGFSGHLSLTRELSGVRRRFRFPRAANPRRGSAVGYLTNRKFPFGTVRLRHLSIRYARPTRYACLQGVFARQVRGISPHRIKAM